MILLDTTVLVYAKGQSHPLRDPCRDLIEAVAHGSLDATTTVEVIQEFMHVRARRRGRGDAAQLGRDYAALLAPLLSPTGQDLDEGISLFERSESLGAFDAVLTAVGARAGISCVVSANVAFAELSHVAHVVPDRAGVSRLLRG
jgi:predicted nucleic acid-binding protein